jgi:hypothetical protein
VAEEVFQGLPYPFGNQILLPLPYVGITTDDHSDGIGVACFGGWEPLAGLHLCYQGAGMTFNPAAATTQTVVARLRVLSTGTQVNRVFVGLINSLPGSGFSGYLLCVDFDATSNNIVLYRCPDLNAPAGWVAIATSSADLTGTKGSWVILKLSRRNRGTLASPNYWWKGGVVGSDGTSIGITETNDNTYSTFLATVGARGDGVAGHFTHMHLDRFTIMETDRIPSDQGFNADIYPWILNASQAGGWGTSFTNLASDVLDSCGDPSLDPPTSMIVYGNQQNGDYFTLDMSALKSGVCRVDLINVVNNHPGTLAIDVSADNFYPATNWTRVWGPKTNVSREVYATFTPITCRHIRVILTAAAAWKWRLNEVKIYPSAASLFYTVGTITEYGLEVNVANLNWRTIWDAWHEIAGAIGWHFWINARTGTLNFSSAQGTDKSATIKFQENRNISNFKYSRTLLEKVDRVIVLGKNAGSEQLSATKEAASLPADYRERVFVAKSIGNLTVLQNLANTLYNVLSAPIEQIHLDVIDNYATGSFDVGDTINVDITSRGVAGNYRVLNITRTFQDNTETVAIDVASQAVIALAILQQILTQDSIVAQNLLQKKIQDLDVSVK